MKPHIALGVILPLIAAWGFSMRQAWLLGQGDARTEAQASTLKRTVDTLNIISAGVQDMQQTLARLHAENQRRNQEGEVRREQLRNDIATDKCARALPDVRFTDRLHKHAERAAASAVNSTIPKQPNSSGNAPSFPSLADMGKSRDMERQPAGRTGNL